MNFKLEEVKTNIGTVKVNRNIKALSTGIWVLTGSVNTANIIMNGSDTLKLILIGINISLVLIYSYTWYQEQQELNRLRKEQQEMLKEEGVQKRLIIRNT